MMPASLLAGAKVMEVVMDISKEELLEKVKAAAKDNRISCTVARKMGEELGVPLHRVGEACDELGIKIHACELGCFK
jgi:hypothetical protein